MYNLQPPVDAKKRALLYRRIQKIDKQLYQSLIALQALELRKQRCASKRKIDKAHCCQSELLEIVLLHAVLGMRMRSHMEEHK